MPPKPKAGTVAQSALNIRLTAEDLHLLDQQVEIEAQEAAARSGEDAGYLDVTRASLVRRWIRVGARAKGLLPPLPVQVSLPFPPVVPVVAPSAPSSPVVHEAAPVAPPRTKRKAPDVDTVRAALLAARAAGVAQRAIADAVGVDPSSLSKFQNTDPAKHRPLSAERLADLVAYLTKTGHLQR